MKNLFALAAVLATLSAQTALAAPKCENVNPTFEMLKIGSIVTDELAKAPEDYGLFEKENDIGQTFAHYNENELTMQRLFKKIVARVNSANFSSTSTPCRVNVNLASRKVTEMEMARYYLPRQVIELTIALSTLSACDRDSSLYQCGNSR
ncbi:MAG: hypothetical protein ACXWQO_11120 [Bdellovibrionota bacterium]